MSILWILLQLFLTKAEGGDYVTFGVLMARQFISKNNDPIELFSNWFSEARKSETINPEAMALATSGLDGKPSVRMVLLKSLIWARKCINLFVDLEKLDVLIGIIVFVKNS